MVTILMSWLEINLTSQVLYKTLKNIEKRTVRYFNTPPIKTQKAV